MEDRLKLKIMCKVNTHKIHVADITHLVLVSS